MAEKSIFWSTGTTGDGTSTYTQDDLTNWLYRTFGDGVLAGYLSELAVSGTASPITVAAGGAYVRGFPYENTAAVPLTVPTPTVGTTGYRVVLRANYATKTVRITLRSSQDGVATPPPVTQTEGSVWEVSLATLTVATTGVITVTDTRPFIHIRSRVNEAMLDSTVAGNGLTGGGGAPLAVNPDNSSIEVSSDKVRVKAGGINGTHIAAGSIGSGHIAAGAVGSGHIAAGAVGTSHIANDAVDHTKVGAGVVAMTHRQGGSATAWNVDGTTNYSVTGPVRIQGGAVKVVILAGEPHSAPLVYFPVPFSQPPLMLVSADTLGYSSPNASATLYGPAPTTAFYIKVPRPDDVPLDNNVSVWVTWLAIGPE